MASASASASSSVAGPVKTPEMTAIVADAKSGRGRDPRRWLADDPASDVGLRSQEPGCLRVHQGDRIGQDRELPRDVRLGRQDLDRWRTRRGRRRDLAEDVPELVRKLPGDLVPDAHQRRSQRRLAFIGVNGRDDALQELLGAAAQVDRQCRRIRADAHPVASQQLQPERPAGFILLVLDRHGQIGRFLPARRRQRRRRARLGRLERGEARSVVDHRDLAGGHAHDLALDRVGGPDLAAAYGSVGRDSPELHDRRRIWLLGGDVQVDPPRIRTGVDPFEAVGQQLDRQGVRPVAPGRSDDRGGVDVGVRLGRKPDIEVERRRGHDGVRCVEMGVGDAGWIGADGRRWRGSGHRGVARPRSAAEGLEGPLDGGGAAAARRRLGGARLR